MAIRRILLTAICLVVVTPRNAEACTCGRRDLTPSDAWVEYADHVFEAIVGESIYDGSFGERVPIHVLRVWKGDAPTHLGILGGPCVGTSPEPGSRVLFYDTTISHCTVTFPSESPEYAAHIAWLGTRTWDVDDPPTPGGCAHCSAHPSRPSALGVGVGVALLFLRLRRRRRAAR